MSSADEQKQCYGCGGWGHTPKNCYHEHLTLHAINREWVAQQVAILDQNRETPAKESQQATVMKEKDMGGNILEYNQPFELNMVMIERAGREKSDKGIAVGLSFHFYATREEESSIKECPIRYPANDFQNDGNTSVIRIVIEESVGTQVLKEAEEYHRRWILDSGTSSHYIKDMTKFRSYRWLENLIRISTGKGPICGIGRDEVEVKMEIVRVVIGEILLVLDLDVESDLLSVGVLM